MVAFQEIARQWWMTYLPKLTAELKRTGQWRKMTDAAGERATEELIARLRNGENYQAAREIVERQYLLLPPETD